MSEFMLIAISAILSSNVVAVSGVSAISLQSEKRHFTFMIFTTFLSVLSIIICGVLYNVFEKYVLLPLEATYLKLFVVICLSYVCAFISRSIVKASSKECYFFYEKSYQLPTQTIVVVATLMLMDFGGKLLTNLFSLAMFSVGFILVQIIFYGLYERLDNVYTIKAARNVPVMLFTLSIVSMIFYVISMCF